MKFRDLKVLNEQDLSMKKLELTLELMKENTQVAMGTVPKSPRKIRELRRTIARINTIHTSHTNHTSLGGTKQKP